MPGQKSYMVAMAACLVFGVMDLGVLDLVLLPRAVRARVGRRARAAAPVAPRSPLPALALDPPRPPAPSAPPAPLAIEFETNGDVLQQRARAAVERLAVQIAGNSGWEVTVEGHSDWRGSERRNRVLSERRAQAVAALLEQGGVPAARVALRAYGSTRPVYLGDDPASWRRNRRAEVRVQGTRP